MTRTHKCPSLGAQLRALDARVESVREHGGAVVAPDGHVVHVGQAHAHARCQECACAVFVQPALGKLTLMTIPFEIHFKNEHLSNLNLAVALIYKISEYHGVNCHLDIYNLF